MRSAPLLPALLCLVFAAPSARADLDPDTEVAKRRFRAGAQAYERSDYAAALREFEAAQRVKALPAFDYNIARCLDRLERYPEAVAAYQRFVAGTPDPFEAEEANKRIQILKSRLGGSAPVPKAGAEDAAANRMLEQGMALFKAGQLTDARAVFYRLRKLVPEKANPYRWLGMTYARLNECRDAVTNLDNFLERVAENDPRVAEVVTLRDRCRRELGPQFGTLAVESTPPGAEVLLDDTAAPSLGRTPYRNPQIAPGDHVVYLRKAGFELMTKMVTIARHGVVSLDVVLRPVGAPVAAPRPVARPPVAPSPAPPPAARPTAATSPPPPKPEPRPEPKPEPRPTAKPPLEAVRKVEPPPRVEPAEPPAEPESTTPPRPATGRRWLAPALVGVVALGLAGAGAGLVLSVGPEFERLQGECRIRQCTADTGSDLQLRANLGYGVLAAAGAAVAVDVVLWVLAARKPGATRAADRALWMAPTLGGMVVGGALP